MSDSVKVILRYIDDSYKAMQNGSNILVLDSVLHLIDTCAQAEFPNIYWTKDKNGKEWKHVGVAYKKWYKEFIFDKVNDLDKYWLLDPDEMYNLRNSVLHNSHLDTGKTYYKLSYTNLGSNILCINSGRKRIDLMTFCRHILEDIRTYVDNNGEKIEKLFIDRGYNIIEFEDYKEGNKI